MTPGDRCSMKNSIVLEKPVSAPQRNGASPKSVTAGHGATSQQRRSPGGLKPGRDPGVEISPRPLGAVKGLESRAPRRAHRHRALLAKYQFKGATGWGNG